MMRWYTRARSYSMARILSPDQNDAHKRMALLHEVLHGCWHLTDKAHQDDEAAIRILAGPLLDTLRRNPLLVAYLVEDDHAITQGVQSENDKS